MGVDDVRNALTRERLFTETALDVDQDLLVGSSTRRERS